MTGNPTIIFLDEPTSGLDPGTRKGIWNTLQSSKVNRCFFLSTHTMEEAEVLCSKIAIINKGSLKCIGSPDHLKHRFAKGNKLEIKTDVWHEMEVIEYLEELVPGIVLLSQNQGHIFMQTPKNIKISNIFKRIERDKQKYGIRNWGFSQTSLEDIFIAIISAEEGVEITSYQSLS